ncbi:hypothetical protein [Janthinobacterium sp. PC23-8]|uniref:hypothetical protein n=1 Tax=Janthinobacterium sp. PC23-8 TaxID=2012679 RepID=UPI0011401F4D|nr:hypothetical protein [Janthinobacterium sp. PC23-8]
MRQAQQRLAQLVGTLAGLHAVVVLLLAGGQLQGILAQRLFSRIGCIVVGRVFRDRFWGLQILLENIVVCHFSSNQGE